MQRMLLAATILAANLWAREFEVASVKAVDHPVAAHAVSLIINHERLNIDAAALRQVIGLAFAIQRVRVIGGPAWIDSDLYDIVAKADRPDVTRDEIREMLQSLLAERFKLATHRETRELPEYTLVAAKDGPKLTRAGEKDQTGIAPEGSTGRVRFAFRKTSFVTLVNFLANTLGSPVIDKSGVEAGEYNFTLEWTEDDSGPSLFKALQEQLGLRLEAKKMPTEVLVIDHIEKAGAN
jgi:uncharacterized protein (TIGR03435 family)